MHSAHEHTELWTCSDAHMRIPPSVRNAMAHYSITVHQLCCPAGTRTGHIHNGQVSELCLRMIRNGMTTLGYLCHDRSDWHLARLVVIWASVFAL